MLQGTSTVSAAACGLTRQHGWYRSFLAMLLWLVLAGAAAPAVAQLALSDEERRYLADNAPVVFVSQTNYPPFEFVDVTGEHQGIMVELARWIATEAGFHAEFTDAVFQQAQEDVLEGRAHVLTSFFYSTERDRLYDFTETIFLVPASIFVHIARPDISRLEDLRGKRVATQHGDYAEAFLKSRGVPVELVRVDDFAAAAQAVVDGEADAMIGDEQIVRYVLYRNKLSASMKIVGTPLYEGRNGMAMLEGSRVLQSIMNKGIEHARKTGTLDRLEAKWLGVALQPRPVDPLAYWPYAVVVALALALVAYWNLRLRALVNKRTAELSSSEQRLRDILQGTQAGTWELDVQSGHIEINGFWAEMLGHEVDALRPMTIAAQRALVHPDDREQVRSTLERHLAGASPHYSSEHRMQHCDGRWVWVLERGQVSRRSAQGAPVTVSGTLLDISASKKNERELELAASVFRNAREGIIITDAQGDIIEVNDAFVRITGYSRAEAAGRNPSMLSSGLQSRAFYAEMWRQMIEEGGWEGELWNKRKSGELYPQMVTVSTVRDRHGKIAHFVAVFTDIARQKEYERLLERMAYYDDLTGLPNRVLLGDRLKQAMTRGKRSGENVLLAYIDLDGFKEVNDTYGHDAGDQVLVAVARRLSTALREEDTVARFGGDEFVAVISEHGRHETLDALVQRLIERICEPIGIEGGHTVRVSGSIGIVHHATDFDIEPEQLIRQADQAMYQAKQAGKNRHHVFDSARDRAIRDQHVHIECVRRGLADGQFTLHYQPKVDMRTGGLVGVEALLRWNHPTRGLLYPADFLPAVQNDPVSVELGEWVLRTALAQCMRWRLDGRPIPVSVNIDAIHLQQARFAEQLHALLAANPGIHAGDLELEILETSALEDVAHVSSVMQRCRAMGVDFALDDFGTGYASLTYLRHLPAGLLKIDRSFVRDMLDDPQDLTILEGVLGLATAFRRRVIAEGIETVDQGRMLLAIGYQLGQGFAIAPPMPAAELQRWSASWAPPPQWLGCGALAHRDRVAVQALVDLRACARALLGGEKGLRPDVGELACSQCRVGLWLRHAYGDAGETNAELAAFRSAHGDYLEQGRRLIEARNAGQADEVAELTAAIEALRDRLLEQVLRWVELRTRR